MARTLWTHAEAHTPEVRFADYTQAIMDLGATLCRRRKPDCAVCPVSADCAARATGIPEEYPGRKPKKDKPVRGARMFVLHALGGCLLEKRPAPGLWGGLWTPPERTTSTSTQQICSELQIAAEAIVREHAAPAFRHTFTHFHLDIEPVYVEMAEPVRMVADRADLHWHVPGGNEALGLSVPAVKLLASLEEFALT